MDIKTIIQKCGGPVALAKELGTSSQAISQWKQVPWKRCADVERISGIQREILRPDVYAGNDTLVRAA